MIFDDRDFLVFALKVKVELLKIQYQDFDFYDHGNVLTITTTLFRSHLTFFRSHLTFFNEHNCTFYYRRHF